MSQFKTLVLVWMLCCGVALSEPPTTPTPIGVPQEPVAQPEPRPDQPDPLGEPQTLLEPSQKPPTPAKVAANDVVISNPAKPKPIPTPSKNSVRLESKKVLGVSVKLVVVNLENPKVRVLPVLPLNAFKKGAQFNTLVAGSSAVAVLNAGHFHPRTFSPVGDIIYNGRYIAFGRLRTGLAITKNNEAKLWLRPYAPSSKSLETLIGTGPLLVYNREINPVPKAEGYSDPAIWGRAARTAVGILSTKKLVFVSTREKLTLRELGKVMKALGSRDAIALDGGSSVGFAWRGQVMIHPKRKIAFGVGVYIRK
jgi:hypothetical protein